MKPEQFVDTGILDALAREGFFKQLRQRTDERAMGATRRAKLEVRGVSLDLYNERTRKSLPVLRDLDFEVFDGELVSIVGPSRLRQVHVPQRGRRADPGDIGGRSWSTAAR